MLYMYIQIQELQTFFADDSVKIGGVMTSDQVPMTEVGRLMANRRAGWLAKPHQVIV